MLQECCYKVDYQYQCPRKHGYLMLQIR